MPFTFHLFDCKVFRPHFEDPRDRLWAISVRRADFVQYVPFIYS